MLDDHRLASRRQVLAGGASAAMGLVLDTEDGYAQQALAPTPACHAGEMPTRPQIEGPFFKPASPLRGDLREPGMAGRPAELAGFVLTRSCRPVAGALIELWHADDQGAYDNTGFRLRGHLFADAKGRYTFKTIMPGLYPGRRTFSHQGAGCGREPGAHHPTLFSRRAAKPGGRFVSSRADHAGRRLRRCVAGAVRSGAGDALAQASPVHIGSRRNIERLPGAPAIVAARGPVLSSGREPICRPFSARPRA